MIVDDHEIVRRGIAEIVDRDESLGVVAEAGSVADAVRRADLVRPDVILVDLLCRRHRHRHYEQSARHPPRRSSPSS